jgi:hypothetical protein
VALKYGMSSVDRFIKLDDTPIPDELRLIKNDPVPFHTCQETAAEAALTRVNEQINGIA